MVDFARQVKKQATSKELDPIKLYSELDRKSDTGPLRPAQDFVLREWHENRRESTDEIIKLHTGQGKTIVGLLTLLSRLNEGLGPCLYLTPNRYLADQTCAQAERFGIPVLNCNDTNDIPLDFIQGHKIYVTTVHKLFNGLTKFGLRSNSISVGSIVMDDCHACIDAMKNACSIYLKSEEGGYKEILDLFSNDLEEQGAGTYREIMDGDYNSILPVPYWAWIDRKDEVTKIIGNYRDSDSIRYAWPILKDTLDACYCIVSGRGLEITPYITPIETFGSFARAKHRLYMSATVSDDSFLVKGLRLDPQKINNPIIYPDEKWLGEKMILIPALIDARFDPSSLIKVIGSPNTHGRKFGSVVICSSSHAATKWADAGAVIADTNTVGSFVQQLTSGIFSHTICIINRYDGIDLPDSACRLLVLDSKPFSGTLSERYIDLCRPNSEVTSQRAARSIEQGMGRGVRGEKDFCAIILLGSELAKTVQDKSVITHFSAQTQRQVEIGLEIADISKYDVEHGVTGTDVTIDCLNKFIRRDQGWKDFYQDRMDGTGKSSVNKRLLDIYVAELSAETLHQQGRYQDARSAIQKMLDDKELNQEERGWYTQEMARLVYRFSKSDALMLQQSAHRANGYLLKPKDLVVFKRLEPLSHRRVSQIIEWAQESPSHQDLLVRINSILDDLRFGVVSERFEAAVFQLGLALGYASERPDKVWKKGPDNLWCLERGQYLLVECKNEAKLERSEIHKTETGQFNNSYSWFSENYPGATAHCVMIINTKTIGAGAGFNMETTIMREPRLRALRRNVKAFFQEFLQVKLLELEPRAVDAWLNHHSLGTDALIQRYSEPPAML
jgi:replicative superfamily II helicase